MIGQLLCHLWGDYLLQSDWMARNKTKDSRAAFIHAACYLLPFLLLTRSIPALAVMFFTHAAIDRWRLARYLVWAKNFIAPTQLLKSQRDPCTDRRYPPHKGRNYPWEECSATGYPVEIPVWMAVWLMILADNTIHLTINYLALRFL